MKYRAFGFTTLILILLMQFSCKQADDVYMYEVNDVHVTQPGVDKINLKTELEFISLAYTDLFGTTLTADELTSLGSAYSALGDKVLISDVIIRNFLNDPTADVPNEQEMRADIDQFISNTYKKFYIREPGEYERWYFRSLIENDADMTPGIIFYAFLTSDEYRFF